MNTQTSELSDQGPKREATEAGEMVAQMAKVVGLQPASLLPVFLHLVGVTLGNSAKVATSMFPDTLNLALGCLVCEDGQGPLTRAIDFLSKPIRSAQDADVIRLGERARRILEGEVVRMEVEDAKFLLQEQSEGAGLNTGLTQNLRRSIRP